MKNKLNLKVSEINDLLPVIKKYPFATAISVLGEQIEISSLPIIARDLPDGSLQLLGHLSTGNPQWLHLKNRASLTLIFNGPNTYINSSWYAVNDVSTWNYITVRAQGTPIIHEDYKTLIEILKCTTDHVNNIYEDKWDFYIPEDLKLESELTSAIGGFSIVPEKFLGLFKLSQSKSISDQINIINKLNQRNDENSRLIAEYMRNNVEQEPVSMKLFE